MWIDVLAIFIGLAILVWSADIFISGTASIAKNYGVSPLLIGLTIVGLGTSAPEILVSVFSSLQGNSGLAVGNALGSNITNIGLILGSTALIAPIAVHSNLLKRELPILLFTGGVCFLLVVLDNTHSRMDGLLLVLGLIGFLWWLIHNAISTKHHDRFSQELEEEIPDLLPIKKAWLYFFIGTAGLLGSSKLLVWGAVNIAEYFGISDLVIGLTIVALGTSLPELAASVTSILKNEDDLAIGNIIGSNMYNLLAVYSVPALISPGQIEPQVVERDFPVMIAFTVMLFVLGYGIKKTGSISRWEGALLIAGYGGYQWSLYLSAIAVV